MSSVGAWRWNRETGAATWSPGLLRLLGLTSSPPPGAELDLANELMCPEDAGLIRDGLDRLRRGLGPPDSFSVSVSRPDGSVVRLRFDFEVEAWNDDAPVSATAYAWDETASWIRQQVAGARIRLMEFAPHHTLHELLSRTIDEAEALTGSKIGFYHFVESDQLNLTLQAWSKSTTERFCTAKGQGEHYPVAQAGVWVDCLHELRPVIHNDYLSLPHRKGLPEGHAPVVREAVVPTVRDGLVVALLGVGNKERDYDEHDIEILVALADLAWDIASRKRAEESLIESETRFRSLFDTMRQGVVFHDKSGGITMANDAAVAALGLTVDQLQGRTSVDPRWRSVRADGTDYPGDEHPASISLRTGRPVYGAIMGIHNPRHGAQRWLEIDSVPRFRPGETEPFEVIATFTDITDRLDADRSRVRESQLLGGLTSATMSMLSHAMLTDDDILAALSALGVAARADRAYVFEHQSSYGGGRGTLSLRFAWTFQLGGTFARDPRTQNLPWDEVAPTWYDVLSDGRIVLGRIEEFADVERRSLGFHGAQSVLEIPIMLADRLWGFLGFDTSDHDRMWGTSEVELLVQAATSLGTAMELREQATRDPLTALFNRRFLDDSLRQELARVSRDADKLSVVALDLDGFKSINDRWGHGTGDQVLRHLAEVLRDTCRSEDTVCRVGGDEFLVVVPGADGEAACESARRWAQAIFDASDSWLPDGTRISVSAGVAQACSDDTREHILAAADLALLAAKHGGRDRVVVADRESAT